MLVQAYAGKGRDRPAGAPMFYFYGYSKDGWQYLKYHRIVILAGEERFRFDPHHVGEIKLGLVIEHMVVKPDVAQFESIAKSAKIEGVVGNDEFSFTPAQMDALHQFAKAHRGSHVLVVVLHWQVACKTQTDGFGVDQGRG